MKKNKKENCTPCNKTSIGGQALLEGIMMRGPKRTALAVRNTSGEIVLEDFETQTGRSKITKMPFIRGIFGFIDSMRIGTKCLMRSAEISGLEELEVELEKEKAAKKRAKKAKKGKIETESAENADDTAEDVFTTTAEAAESAEPKTEKSKGGSAMTGMVMTIGTVLGIVLSIVLFIYLPTFLSTLILGENAATEHPIWLAVISGFMKVAILVAYMAIIPAAMKDIRRTFMYHGAEHKTIFCYEHGKELTVENVRSERRFHPRCGTSFLFLMMFVSIIIMIPIGFLLKSVLPEAILNIKWLYTLIRTGIAILFIPIMMGVGYELIKLAGRKDNWLTRIISAPGLWMQRITTREPDDSMIECAITAMKAVIPDDQSDKL